MEEDIQNHSPTVMFRGTPCTIRDKFVKEISIKYEKPRRFLHDVP